MAAYIETCWIGVIRIGSTKGICREYTRHKLSVTGRELFGQGSDLRGRRNSGVDLLDFSPNEMETSSP